MTMPTVKQRVPIALAAMIVAAICGSSIAYFLGGSILLKLAARRLDQDAARVVKEVDRSLAESRAALAAMNASPYPPCADQELVYFRSLLFQSRYLKDVGRIQAGKIGCSAALGRLPQPPSLPKPEFQLQDDEAIYSDLAPYRDGEDTPIALQLDGSYVVFRPDAPVQVSPSFARFTETVIDASNGRIGVLRGAPLAVDAAILTNDGDARLGKTLYATRCSTRGLSCVTGAVSVGDALDAHGLELAVLTAIGGLTGAFLGFFVAIVYRRSRGMEQQLRRALRAGKLGVVYQPVVNLTTRRIVGAEALVRWIDEDGFEIEPEIFVRIAEERGFVNQITKLILHHSLLDFGETLRSRAGFRLNINVAGADLADPAFLPMLAHALEEAEVPTQRLGIEITERGTARQQAAMDTVLQLRRRGHRVYIDDFGTGYSSLTYLRELAIDAVKIDRSFTKAIGTESATVGVVPQILAMAEELHLQVVVEGIENVEQARYFSTREQRFLAQGWLFGHPLSAADFHTLLAEDTKNAEDPPKPLADPA
jgi:sensor c-di-GMP phosphodiesterase-like protein